MPRHARIDTPGLLQHVIVRGVARCDIFLDDEDRQEFLQRLKTLLVETNVRCFGWAFLDNHVHLLLLPTEEPLARLMRRLLTGYAVTFNLRHKRSGHLFQNRYKSIVCDADNYLLELIRYIHLNPVRAGVVENLEALSTFRWCGHRQLLGAGDERLLCADEILALFARREKVAVARYLDFMADGLRWKAKVKLSSGGRRISQFFNSALADDEHYDDRILGGGEFTEQVLDAAGIDAQTHLSLEELISRVADYCGLEAEDLSQPCRQADIVVAKALICYWATRRCRIPGTEVAKSLGYSASATSLAAQRGQRLILQHEDLKQLLE